MFLHVAFVPVSLRRRRNLTTVSNVCEAAPISLFWVPNALNELPEVRFEFPFKLIGKSTTAFSTGQSWRVLKSWYTGGGKEQGFRRYFADGLIKPEFSLSVAQAKRVPLEGSSEEGAGGACPTPHETTCGILTQLVFCKTKLCGLLVLK